MRADSRGANCCTEIRAILDCDPVGPCLGYEGDCEVFVQQFAGVQGSYFFSDGPGEPPTEHEYIDDYVCHAFPDDAYVTDQLFVGLISVAVALPIDMFLGRAFEIANEGELPGNWLDAPTGVWKLILGKHAHNNWRLDDPRRPVSELTRWMVGGGAESDFQVIRWLVVFALRRLWALMFDRNRAPEASFPKDEDDITRRSSVSESAGELSTRSAAPTSRFRSSSKALSRDGGGDTIASRSGGDASEAASSGASARSAALEKRLYASAGLLGVYVCWTIFAWVIFTVRRAAASASEARALGAH